MRDKLAAKVLAIQSDKVPVRAYCSMSRSTVPSIKSAIVNESGLSPVGSAISA